MAMLSELVSSRTYSIHEIDFHLFFFVGPNELSIRDVDSLAPLMSPNGFEKGPRRSHMPYILL